MAPRKKAGRYVKRTEVNKLIEKKVVRMSEINYIDTNATQAIDNNGALVCVTNVPQGTTDSDRKGD